MKRKQGKEGKEEEENIWVGSQTQTRVRLVFFPRISQNRVHILMRSNECVGSTARAYCTEQCHPLSSSQESVARWLSQFWVAASLSNDSRPQYSGVTEVTPVA